MELPKTVAEESTSEGRNTPSAAWGSLTRGGIRLAVDGGLGEGMGSTDFEEQI